MSRDEALTAGEILNDIAVLSSVRTDWTRTQQMAFCAMLHVIWNERDRTKPMDDRFVGQPLGLVLNFKPGDFAAAARRVLAKDLTE